MGRWYVISLIPNWIEENATNSFDEYTLNKDGSIDTYWTGKVKWGPDTEVRVIE